MNIVYYKGNGYFDYMKYYNPNDVNIFIGGRCTGKTFSISNYRGICEVEEFEYHVGASGTKYFLLHYTKKGVIVPLEQPYMRLQIGAVYTFLRMEDFLSVKREVFPHEVTHTIE